MLIVPLILLQIFIFIGLVYFLRKILNRNVISATNHLEHMSAEYAKKEDEIKKRLEESQRQSREVLANAQRDAKQKQESIIAKAQEEKDKLLNNAKQKAEEIVQQADRTRQALMGEINQRIEGRALERATELVQQALPEQTRAEVHQSWFDNLISDSLEQLNRLNIPQDVSEVRVVSAFELSSKQRQALKAKIKQQLGREIELKEEVEPGVIAGVVVNVGSLVLDGSLRFKIREVASAQQAGS